jgi:DNA (cytosine-5)-methyltransferase 1
VNYLSLFSGIGGFDLAFTRVGMQCAGMVEIDKNCQNVLHRHFEYVHVYDDVKEINGSTYKRGAIDVICGGFPCQDLSIAGKRAGLAGERSGLWYEFARIIDQLEPRWVVAENVPGLLSSNKGADFEIIIRWLAERGYGMVWRVLDAQYFGVAQRRRRVFIVASLGSGRAAEILFEREGMSRDTPPSREAGQGTPSATLRGFGHGWQGQHNGGLYVNETEQSLTVGGTDLTAICMSSGQANAEIVKDGSPSLTLLHEQPIVATSRTLRQGKEGGGKGYLGLENRAMTLGRQEQNIFFTSEQEPKFGEIPGTLGTYNGRRASVAGAAVGVRRLTPTECERLQGFPDGWTDGQSDSTRYRQLGNAVAVPVVEWIAKRIPDNTIVYESDLLHTCGDCGAELQIVRPGKYQCPKCGK